MHHLDSHVCACPICAGETARDQFASGVVDLSPNYAPVFSDSQVIGQISSGLSWSGSTITYSFLQSAPWWTVSLEGPGFQAFTAKQQAETRTILSAWDDLIAPSIIEESSNPGSNINFASSNYNVAYAHAYFPGNYLNSGEVWINSQTYTQLYYPDPGDYSYMTIMHEAGHALGLGHPGSYNGGSPTYFNDAEYAQDTHQWTVMSYFSAGYTGADWHGGTGWQYAQTPMVHDVLAIQSLYGADLTTRTGDTVYGFNSNTGNSLFDFSLNRTPVLTIYDAGGEDTLDLSGFNRRAIIDLSPGSYSSAGGISSDMTYNIGIAGTTIIENAIGGSANDTIYGNSANNSLSGGGGDDTLFGYGGNDSLSGGSGTDTASFTYSLASYAFTFSSNLIQIFGEGNDIVYDDVEWLQFADFSISYADLPSYFTEVEIENVGSYRLISYAGGYHIENSGGDRVSLTYQGNVAGPNTFAGYSAVHAEADGTGGYHVLWRYLDGTLTYWNVDASGEFRNAARLATHEYPEYETLFSFDLNADGNIGQSYALVEDVGNQDLLISSSGQYVIENLGGDRVSLTYQGNLAGPNTFAGYSAIHAEADGTGGYHVLWRYLDGTLTYWNVDASGEFRNAARLATHEYPEYETLFSFDLNADGNIGQSYALVEDVGNQDLLISSSGQYVIENPGGDRVGLTYLGTPTGSNTFAGYNAIHAEADGTGGYHVLWRYLDGTLTYWNVDASGEFRNAARLATHEYPEYETLFSFDLNADGNIGQSYALVEDVGNQDLLISSSGQYVIENPGGDRVGLTYLGTPTGSNTFAGYNAIHAEADGTGGYHVLWRYLDGTLTYWNVDASGEFRNAVRLTAGEYAEYEDFFSFDIDKDGAVGASALSPNLENLSFDAAADSMGTDGKTDNTQFLVNMYATSGTAPSEEDNSVGAGGLDDDNWII